MDAFRNLDRFAGSGREPLTTWRSFEAGGRPLDAAKEFQKKRQAGSPEAVVGLADSTGRAQSRFPPVGPLRDPLGEAPKIPPVVEPSISTRPATTGTAPSGSAAKSITGAKSVAATLSVAAEEF